MELQDIWPSEDVQSKLPSNTQIVTEKLTRMVGSCCDSGRNEYAPCGGHWWYGCPDFGLANITTWVKVGKNGYTFPTSTEHKGVCEYSKKRLCDLPIGCDNRIPTLVDYIVKGVNHRNVSMCGEVRTVKRYGF